MDIEFLYVPHGHDVYDRVIPGCVRRVHVRCVRCVRMKMDVPSPNCFHHQMKLVSRQKRKRKRERVSRRRRRGTFGSLDLWGFTKSSFIWCAAA